MITAPGIYPDMPAAEYFADPCPVASLTQSIAKILIDQSPMHAWHAHPKLNSNYQHDDDTKFDAGNCAHKMLIGRGKDIVVLDQFNDWRTKAAQTTREELAQAGKLGVLGKTARRASAMVNSAHDQLILRGLSEAFQPGHGDGELVIAWNERDIWFRQMIDWLSTDRCMFWDYKTTDMSVAPYTISRMMATAGWPIQAAMAERGLGAVDPLGYRRRYLFVVQEAYVPYQLVVVEIGEAALTMGRKMLDHAANIWAGCMRANIFPGYPLEIITPEYPGWAESQWVEREMREQIAADHIMAG